MMASTGYDSTGDVIRHDIGQLRGTVQRGGSQSGGDNISSCRQSGGDNFFFLGGGGGGGTDGVTDHICKFKDRRLSITERFSRWLYCYCCFCPALNGPRKSKVTIVFKVLIFWFS